MNIGFNMLFKKRWILACFALLSIASCQKALDINVDPNKAIVASPNLVLPAAQIELGSTVGNAWNFIGSMWAQYWTGGHGVSSSGLEFYTMQSVDVQGSWTVAYGRALQDFDYLIKSGQPVYAGIAKICSAYEYQMLADLFGDIPFSEALKGSEGIFTPKFDSQTDVYNALIPMIDEGIAQIQTTGPDVQIPGNDDLMYGGNISKWITFANTLKLKILVRRGDYTAARTLMNTAGVSFIESAANNAQITWAENAKNTNPLWARFNSRIGIGMYYVATTAIIDTLNNLSDPRADFFFKRPTRGGVVHRGVSQGDVNELYANDPIPGTLTAVQRREYFSQPSVNVFSETTPTYFISAWESKFLQAEVLVRNNEDASVLFADAVQESFNSVGAGDASAYITSLGFSGTQDNQLNALALQKWISMTSTQMAESWLETLRFDRAGNFIFTGGVSSIYSSPALNSLGSFKFPTSFVYPTQEIALNPNAPTRVVTDRRFWDVN